MASEPYDPDNLLDRHSHHEVLEVHYEALRRRERELCAPLLPAQGQALSVGAGWHPGRHLFPAPAWRLAAVDPDSHRVGHLRASGTADEAHIASADRLPFGDGAFDAVLMRLVLHHIAWQGPLAPALAEAARVLRPGGLLIAVEPSLWHPVGLGLAAANRLGIATSIHGTPDDVPLSPRAVARDVRAAGFRQVRVQALTFSWRRLPARVQRALERVERAGTAPGTRWLGHTFLLTARRA